MIISKENLAAISDDIRKTQKIVFTNGVFDILHYGHVRYLESAKRLGDILIVGLNSDSSTKRLKGTSRPVNYEKDRAYVLSCLKSVDIVCLFEEDTPIDLIEIVKPDFLVKGGDYVVEKIVGHDFVINNGGNVMTIPFEEGRSTTNIISKLNDNSDEN